MQLDFIFINTLGSELQNCDLVLVESILSPIFVCLLIWKNVVENWHWNCICIDKHNN